MEITITQQNQWTAEQPIAETSIRTKWLSMLDSQESNKTLWYVFSLIAQGVLFLPLPTLLIYYFHAPIFILPVTLCLYFANIIAGMGGAGIRLLLSVFSMSVLLHVLMVIIFVL